VAVIAFGATIWSGCSDQQSDSLTTPSARLQSSQASAQGVAAAIAAQERHTPALMRIPGVVGTAVGLLPDGRATVRIFLSGAGAPQLPDVLDGVPTRVTVSGLFMARSDPTTRLRPAPLGYSVGHPLITAGTIGALVANGAGSKFVLSNNHVLAASNDASVGDPMLQPGPFDGGTSSDQIGTLFAFRPIDFTGGNNTFDAAIGLTTSANVTNSTPADDGYGPPSAAIYGDANGDGLFDNKSALLGLHVQKYGRTTELTHGQITGINATVSVCYEAVFIFCLKSANFVDQFIVTPGTFSGGGDSGSLIVSDDAGRNPVALLFAGSETETIANRIDLVLNYFGVTIDGGAAPPPTPLTDVAVTGVSAPASVTIGNTVNVVVTVQNVGNQNVPGSFDVTLRDATANVTLGTQSVAGLAPGATANRTFSWNTTGSSLGAHTLTATHTLTDDNAANNQRSTSSSVNPPSVNIHVGDLDAFPSDDGTTWSAVVEITVHDNSHQPLNGATVVGAWSRNGLNANTCTTGELGGNGTCIVLFPGLRKTVKNVSFTVSSVTMAGNTYVQAGNHDPDGSSNGTVIKVNRP
jgi:hypothetical protein